MESFVTHSIPQMQAASLPSSGLRQLSEGSGGLRCCWGFHRLLPLGHGTWAFALPLARSPKSQAPRQPQSSLRAAPLWSASSAKLKQGSQSPFVAAGIGFLLWGKNHATHQLRWMNPDLDTRGNHLPTGAKWILSTHSRGDMS